MPATTQYKHGDSTYAILRKILAVLGGGCTPCGTTENTVLHRILDQLNTLTSQDTFSASVLDTLLTGLTASNTALQPTDSILSAFGDLKFRTQNVKDFGAVLDGVTDDSAALLAAAAAADTAGGVVLIPGTLGVGSLGWVGIALDSLTDVVFQGAGPGSGIRFLHQPSQILQSLGVSIKISNSTRVVFRGLKFDGTLCAGNGPGTAIGFDSCERCAVIDCEIVGTKTGIWSISGQNLSIIGNYLHDLIISGARGMWIGNTNVGTQETNATIAFNIVADTAHTGIGGTLQSSVVTGNRISNAGMSGIAMGSANGVAYQDVSITNNFITGSTAHGVQADTTGTTYVRRVNVTGNVVSNCGQSGIYCRYSTNWNISGNTCFNNSQASGSSAGILVANYATGINVSGNSTFDDQGTKTQYYGILVNSSSGTEVVQDINVVGNTCVGNEGYNIFIGATAGGTADRINCSDNVCQGESATPVGLGFASSGFTGIVSNNVCNGHTSRDIGNGAQVAPDGVFGINNIATVDQGHIPSINAFQIQETWGTSAPATKTWARGAVVWNASAGVGSPTGWRCTVAGTPGTWVALPNL